MLPTMADSIPPGQDAGLGISSNVSPNDILSQETSMGNGTSQSIVLGPSRFQSSYPIHNGYQYQRGLPKYVHPQNRVLPKPVAGQRLRSTDNGSILQTAGTIRGQRRDSTGREGNVDPEVMGILRRRSEMIEKENDCYHPMNLRNHRMFHSDPDIARRMSPDGYAVEEMTDSYSNRRSSGGGAAARASKLKYKKKQRAPDPPPSGSSLPRQMERRPQNRIIEERKNQKNLPCKCVNKTRAPQPPPIVIHPPPPPPLPSSVTTRTKISPSPTSKSLSDHSTRSPSITRAVESHDMKQNYEKNVHPLEKWRNYRSTGDIRIDEQESPSASRTTIFDSKKVPESQNKLPSYLPLKPDPFQKEIQAVTKKIAESRQEKAPSETNQNEKSANKSFPDGRQNRSSSPPKFYFADTNVFKKENSSSKVNSTNNSAKLSVNATHSDTFVKSSDTSKINSGLPSKTTPNCTTIDEIVPSIQRFSPGRQRCKPSSRVSTPTPQQKAEKGWEELSKNMYNKQEDDSDIDIRLRPVLPRKPLEMPKFSATEAWQALGSDGLSSNQSTSEDGPELVRPYKDKIFSSSETDNRPRRLVEVPFGLYEKRINNSNAFKHRSLSDSHWTPRQDLLDDSDISSDGSEEAVVPRIRPSPGEISTRFSLPTVMFSNMRPIGSDIKASSTRSYLEDNTKSKQIKKKHIKPVDTDNGMAPNFRKFLTKKNKYLSEEEIAVSDSNWTFGQHGLQKRGKQYSSDLMLSEKKKHELMMKSNFSDFLGDILVSKANHMRSQMKSSDSGNSNFSFYSTEGVVYLPEKGGFVQDSECSPPTRGRVYDIRRRFDPNLDAKKPNWPKYGKKKSSPADSDVGRRRDLELAKMLEDEVRKRRNKEKISIRQQLQKMKNLNSDDEEDFDDEAYFTEPKSREESQSPFFHPGPSTNFAGSELGYKPFRFSRLGAVTTADSSRLSHWQSSPALLEDVVAKNALQPVTKSHFSSSSVMSSPDPDSWTQPTGIVDSWLQRQRNLEMVRKKHLGSVPILEQPLDENTRVTLTVTDNANDGDVSSSPTPAPQKKKERRKTNIYKQLMDIVRKEEKQLRNAQRENSDHNSRESSYSHRESSSSTGSESPSSTSSYSYSDSSTSKGGHAKNGVPANKEFHSSSYTNSAHSAAPSFQVAFVQPYMPSKSYRPVPFEVNVSSVSGYRMPGLQEESKEVKAEAS